MFPRMVRLMHNCGEFRCKHAFTLFVFLRDIHVKFSKAQECGPQLHPLSIFALMLQLFLAILMVVWQHKISVPKT